MCSFSSLHQFTVTSSYTYTNITVVIDVLVVVYNKMWENRAMLSLHGQLVLDIWPRCWPRVLKLTRLRHVNLAPSLNISADIQHYLIMTQWIILQYYWESLQKSGSSVVELWSWPSGLIRWNNILYDPFTVSNGVGQGSILSPTLFSIYLDSLCKRAWQN